MKNKKPSTSTLKSRKIKDVDFLETAQSLYIAYSTEAIEDRAIFCNVDGLKPVTRRSLWAAHKLGLRAGSRRIKAAKVVGDTMGGYHPHGSSAIYGAMVTANNSSEPMFDGEGNWGSMTDPPAAERYTEVRLSKYSDKVFFDPFYLPIMDMVLNYDDSDTEPFVLNALLPNALVNGNFGIAPGVRTQTPSFTIKSLAKVLIDSLKAKTCTPQTCLPLVFTTETGGIMRQYKGIKSDLLSFYKNGVGRFVFDSSYEVKSKTELRFDKFAPINVASALDRALKINGVTKTRDDSNKHDKYNAYCVYGKMSDTKVVSKVVDAFSAAVNFDIKVTQRLMTEDQPQGVKSLLPTTVPEIINTWITYRIKLEKRACAYWTIKRQKEIDYLNLMRLAVKNRNLIIKALSKPFNDEQLAAYIAKSLKITVEQANIILDLKVRQLKALGDKDLVKKIKALKDEISGYNIRIKKPRSYIARHIMDIVKSVS